MKMIWECTLGVTLAVIILLASSCVTTVSVNESPKDNPSRQQIDTFACQVDSDCTKGGCSGTICQSKQGAQIMSICDWKEEYACYSSISCGCVEGRCAWDKTPEFDSCIVEKQSIQSQDGEDIQ